MTAAPKAPILLLDADVLCHQAAYSSTKTFDWDETGEVVEAYDEDLMRVKIEAYIRDLQRELKASQVIICLSDKENFRKELSPSYKATRKPKPHLWTAAREFVAQGALTGSTVVSMPRLEGDDVIGILHTGPYAKTSIMVSIDKDMRTIPGWLYNPRSATLSPITPENAFLFWMKQVLTGDTTDEYKGCPGIGPAKAESIVSTALLEKDNFNSWKEAVWHAVKRSFERKFPAEKAMEEAVLQARLARILRYGEYSNPGKVRLWSPLGYPVSEI